MIRTGMEACFLSYTIDEHTPAYGGRKGLVHWEVSSAIAKGNTTNELRLHLANHIGTHIDFPYHFSEKGKKCDDYPAGFWVFASVGLLQCSLAEVPEAIGQLPADIELLLLKTGFGAKRGQEAYWSSQPVIPADLAGIFRKRFPRLRVFGFDMISLTSKLDRAEGSRAHQAFLLEHDILVLEDMDLGSLHHTPATVIISPLQAAGADGVPCTVIALG